MLISFEGIDGSGKTTQIHQLRQRLEFHNIDANLYREPGGTEVSEVIRGLLLNPEFPIDPVTEVLLFSSARSQLIAEHVIPKLKNGEWVILDRFYDSTVAYQGYGRQSISIDHIHSINTIASHGVVPDLTFYLRLSREQAQARIQDRHRDRMEQAGDDFYDRVIQGFDTLAASNTRFRTIDADRTPEQIHADVWDAVVKSGFIQ